MARSSSGKTLTIFVVVIAVLLICLTAISVFFFLKEVELRKSAEYNVEQLQLIESRLRSNLQDSRKRVQLLQDKNKESENMIENTLSELDLQKGIAKQRKQEIDDLNKSIDKLKQTAQQAQAGMKKDLTAAQQKTGELQQKIDLLEKQNDQLRKQNDELKNKIDQMTPPAAAAAPAAKEGAPAKAATSSSGKKQGVNLDTIVVNPAQNQGQVVSVDNDSHFLIVNIGAQQGIKEGTVLSVYRGDKYLGDVKVTKVLDAMSAADFLPPLTSDQVKKEDRVIIKE